MRNTKQVRDEELEALRLLARRVTVFVDGGTDDPTVAYEAVKEALEAWWKVAS